MPGSFKDNTKLLIVSKKFENEPEQKRLNLNFLVLIENVLFRSRILFQKRIYSIFFGTKAGKRKLSILKEHWFDIATIFPSSLHFCSLSYLFSSYIIQFLLPHSFCFIPIFCSFQQCFGSGSDGIRTIWLDLNQDLHSGYADPDLADLVR
jgi:hypothetical protein